MSLYDELLELIGSMVVSRDIEVSEGKTKTFHFRELSADDAEEFFGKVDKDPKKNKGLRNRLLSMVVCDPNGVPALTEEQWGKVPNGLANKLQDAAFDVNGLTKAAKEEAKKE